MKKIIYKILNIFFDIVVALIVVVIIIGLIKFPDKMGVTLYALLFFGISGLVLRVINYLHDRKLANALNKK